ncbi:hypothetical protein [Actinomadura sp. DC4]|uniref:hypothetical protein n=1 Tax=Actinomadura sp. DC4 TaxID=3055069 RepID=UPI0025AF1813|nr:hypothetical protein [Actinomadura sp. DC4]MDN3358084.1 hypothetical protein [Actinomadura sp. DC4]
MNDFNDRPVDEPHQDDDRPVAGWPGHTANEHTDEQTGEHVDDRTDEQTDETRDEDEPLVGEVWNDDTPAEADGEHGRPAEDAAEDDGTEGERDHVSEPFGTEEPIIVEDETADETSDTAEEAADDEAEPVAVTDPPEAVDEAADTGVEEPVILPVADGSATETATETETEAASTGARPTAGDDFDVEQLVDAEAAGRLRDRWRDVKAVFVDDPADAVRQAGDLTGEAVDELTAALGRLRDQLGGHAGEEADTERLRVALRGYGSLIERILSR